MPHALALCSNIFVGVNKSGHGIIFWKLLYSENAFWFMDEPGQPEKVDSVYVRNGVADVFMISDPLYPRAEKITLVTDNLSTHSQTTL